MLLMLLIIINLYHFIISSLEWLSWRACVCRKDSMTCALELGTPNPPAPRLTRTSQLAELSRMDAAKDTACRRGKSRLSAWSQGEG